MELRFFRKSQIARMAQDRSKLKEDGDVFHKSRFELYIGLHFWVLTLVVSVVILSRADTTISDPYYVFPMKPNCMSGQTPVKVDGGWRCVKLQTADATSNLRRRGYKFKCRYNTCRPMLDGGDGVRWY